VFHLPNYRRIALNGQPIANGKFPLICVPLVGRTLTDILAELDMVLPKKPDLLEWRVDFFDQISDAAQVIAVAKAIKSAVNGLPLLFTRRSTIEGGEHIAINEDQVIALYAAVCKSKCVDFIDYEMANQASNILRVREAAHANGIKLILSFHNFNCTPPLETLVAKFMTAEQLGADIAKVAVMPNKLDDALTLLAATREAIKQVQIPVVSMSMGTYGSLTRLFGWAYGSALTFAVGARSSAPGQIPIEDMHAMMKIVQKSMGQDSGLN
jgi:3-dehydroquinate dehydratase-1